MALNYANLINLRIKHKKTKIILKKTKKTVNFLKKLLALGVIFFIKQHFFKKNHLTVGLNNNCALKFKLVTKIPHKNSKRTAIECHSLCTRHNIFNLY